MDIDDFFDEPNDGTSGFEFPNLDDILYSDETSIDLPDIEDILYSVSDFINEEDEELAEEAQEIGDLVDDIVEQADTFESVAERIREETENALENNLHPADLRDSLSDIPDDLLDEVVESYREALLERLDGHDEYPDALTYTGRGLFAEYEDVINYLEDFNGGFPLADIIWLILTDEGWEIYVAEDTP